MPYLYRSFSAKEPYCHFPQKSPIVSGSFAKNDLQLKALLSLRHPVALLSVCERGYAYVSIYSCVLIHMNMYRAVNMYQHICIETERR